MLGPAWRTWKRSDGRRYCWSCWCISTWIWSSSHTAARRSKPGLPTAALALAFSQPNHSYQISSQLREVGISVVDGTVYSCTGWSKGLCASDDYNTDITIIITHVSLASQFGSIHLLGGRLPGPGGH
jgi:hypothetical protein